MPIPARRSARESGRERAVRILEQLKSQYPLVADYRYELTATYAWVPVGLFPWQGQFPATPATEQSLLKALDESNWLVAHNPTTAQYACSRPLILAKLGMVCWSARRLAEAEEYFQRAFDAQSTALKGFPDLPSHHRVLQEFLRLRLAQVCYERSRAGHDSDALVKSRALLETCTGNLRELSDRHELADDRLLHSSLPLAYDALSRLLGNAGEHEQD